jgi:DNA-binding CsgD family transcriptional regulator
MGMGSMGNLQIQDWQTFSQLLERLYQLPPQDAFPRHLLHCLRQWVNVDWAAYMQLAGSKIVLLESTAPNPLQRHLAEQLFQAYLQPEKGERDGILTPIAVGVPGARSRQPYLFLPLQSAADWRDCPQSSPQSGLFLSRQAGTFTTYERTKLRQFQPHLERAEQNWLIYCKLLKQTNSVPGAIAASDWVGLLQTLGLTVRQAEVMQLVAQGKDNPTVAKILGCSTQTVKKHLEGIYGRLEVTTRAAAIAVALERTGFLPMTEN